MHSPYRSTLVVHTILVGVLSLGGGVVPVAKQQPASQRSSATSGQAVTVLSDGQLLVTGGESSLRMAGIRDPRTGHVTALTRGLTQERAWHTATVLPDGRVLIVGGTD